MSAAGAGGHCKGKRRLFIVEGKRLRCVCACVVASGGSLELAPAAVAVGHEKMFVTFSWTGGGQ